MAPAIRSVGLNALFLDPGVSGGTETYLRELVPTLVREFPDVRFALATTRRGARALRADGWDDLIDLHELPADDTDRVQRTTAEQVMLPRLARREGWDVLHSLGNRAPAYQRTPSVLTLHDLIFWRASGYSKVSWLAMRWVTRRSILGADAIIALTDAARADVQEAFSLDRDLFTIVPHGVGRSEPAEPLDEGTVRERHDLGDARVVLCVAAKRPHKNQELLVRALPSLPDDVMVVCVGHEEGYEVRLRELAAELGVERRVRLPGYVPDAELEGLWRVASCAAFPTRAEGFGLPVLEAMRRGLPVACSGIDVLREVAGEAALFFDPDDVAGAAAAIAEALERAGELGPAGRERAAGYSWEGAARATFEVYERAVARVR